MAGLSLYALFRRHLRDGNAFESDSPADCTGGGAPNPLLAPSWSRLRRPILASGGPPRVPHRRQHADRAGTL